LQKYNVRFKAVPVIHPAAAILSEHEFSDSFYIVMKKSSYFNVVHWGFATAISIQNRLFFQSTDCNSGYRISESQIGYRISESQMSPIISEDFIESYNIFDNKLWTSRIAALAQKALTGVRSQSQESFDIIA